MKFGIFFTCLVTIVLISLVTACEKSGDCYPGCTSDKECPDDNACLNHRCRHPCLGLCGRNAACNVVNHQPSCSCPEGTKGSPYLECYVTEPTLKS